MIQSTDLRVVHNPGDLLWPSTVPGIPLNLRGGRQIDLRYPVPSKIHIEDIAHALSNICRFAGHVESFYSVAQHSLLVANALPPQLKLTGLLHDATEAYLNDITRALKHSTEMSGYRDLEAHMERVIFAKWGLAWPMDPAIKAADNALAEVEYRTMLQGEVLGDIVDPSTRWHSRGAFQLGFTVPFFIDPMTPKQAEYSFLKVFCDLTEDLEDITWP